MRRLFALLLLAPYLTVGACNDANIKSWVGESDTALLAAWGAPERSARSSTGVDVLTYVERNSSGGPVCQVHFTVMNRKVVNAAHNCPF